MERDGALGFQIIVGGGLGRTPVIGSQIKDFLDPKHLLTYTEAILRVYNRYGRRDNKYKARIKILVRAMTPEGFREKVEVEWASIKNGPGTLTLQEINRAKSSFSPPEYDVLTDINPEETLISDSEAFKNWLKQNVLAHKIPGYAIVNLAIKATGTAPGDMTDEQMELVADLADAFSFGELRVTHEQNITLADVKQKDLYSLWQNWSVLNLIHLISGY